MVYHFLGLSRRQRPRDEVIFAQGYIASQWPRTQAVGLPSQQSSRGAHCQKGYAAELGTMKCGVMRSGTQTSLPLTC